MKNFVCVLFTLLVSLSIQAQDFKFGKVSKEEISQSVHPNFPKANASILYRDINTRFDYNQEDGFIVETEVHERIKIYNKDGYDQATIKIGQYIGAKEEENVTSLKAFTYNLESDKVVDSKLQSRNIFEEKKSRFLEITKFTMPDIKDGSVIEYRYTLRSPYVSSIDEYRFQEEIPVDKVHMRFMAPEYLVYRTHGKGSIPLNVQNEKKNRKITYRYETNTVGKANEVQRGNAELEFIENGTIVDLENVPPLINEPYSGNLNNYMSALQFELAFTKYPNSEIRNYATSWEDVAQKIYDSDDFGKQLGYTKYFKKDISALIAGASSEMEKMLLIYTHVKRKMNWNDYLGVYADEGVKKAYDQGVGNVADINLMLVAMLKFAGIQSSPVLLSTKENGIPFFPTRTGFNYVIAGVVIDNKLILLDGADGEGTPNVLKTDLLNWQGRMIKEDGTSRLIDLFPSKSAVHNAMLNLKITDDMVLQGNVKNRFTGHYARDARSKYAVLEEKEQLQKLESSYDKINVLDITFKDLKNTMKPLTMEYNFNAEDAIDQAGGKIYVSPLLHLANEKNYFTAEERTHPVDFVYPWTDKYIVTISIPEGYEVESIPESLAINLVNNIGSYQYRITEGSGKITLGLQNSINTSLIDASLYKDLQTYFKMIVDKETEKIVLKKI